MTVTTPERTPDQVWSPPPAEQSKRVRPVRPRRPPAPRREESDGASVLVVALTILALVAGWFLLQVLALSGLGESRSQVNLHNQLREQLVAQTAPLGGDIPPGSPVALLEVPTLGLEQVVVEGTASGDLLAGPGHRRDTVLPGQAGVSLVYGRALSYGGPFRAVATLQAGDGIKVTTAQGEYVYRVDGVRRTGDPAPKPPAVGGGRLTLVTAEGQGLLAALTPNRAVYVDATLQGDAAIGAPGRPRAVPESELALGQDTSVLPLVALTLQGLLVAAIGAVLLRRHLAPRVIWVIAVPVLVALAWASTDAAVQLLPNLI